MKLVIIESPYAGDIEANVNYARACVRDSLARGEAPFASHLLYTQPGVLDDNEPTQRQLGIRAGFAWGDAAALHVFYLDRGWSPGMRAAVLRLLQLPGRTLAFRILGGAWKTAATEAAWDEGLQVEALIQQERAAAMWARKT